MPMIHIVQIMTIILLLFFVVVVVVVVVAVVAGRKTGTNVRRRHRARVWYNYVGPVRDRK